MTTILLVEDVKINSDMLKRRLEKKGYEVVAAYDGQEAIDVALSQHPDLILMDIGLPVIDGYEATKHICQNDGTANIPIIALTAYAQEEDKQKAFDAGCVDFETKPIVMKTLVEKIEKYTH